MTNNKKRNYILGGTMGLIILVVIVLLITGNTKASECNLDSDCDFYYTAYSEINPCGACSYGDEKYKCINKEEAQQLRDDFFRDYNGNVCSSCPNPDYDSHICKCINNKCIKELK